MSKTSLAAVAAAAAIVALAGGTGAYANSQLSGDSIRNNTVDTTEVQRESLNGSDVDNGTLTGLDIRNQTLETPDLADGAVNGTKIADGSVQGQDLSQTAKQEIVDLVDAGSTNVVPATVADGLMQFPLAENGMALTGDHFLLSATVRVPAYGPVAIVVNGSQVCTAVPFEGTATCTATVPISKSAPVEVGYLAEGNPVVHGVQADQADLRVVQLG